MEQLANHIDEETESQATEPPSDVYVEWLHDYSTRCSQLSIHGRLEEARTHYTHPEQLYPDYLDMIDEWRYGEDYRYDDFTRAFIYAAAYNRRVMTCHEGHLHTLALWKRGETEPQHVTFVDDPGGRYINACWIQTIHQEVKDLKNILEFPMAAHLPKIYYRITSDLYAWRLHNHEVEGRNPNQMFQSIWWDRDIRGRTSKESARVESQLPQFHQGKIAHERLAEERIPAVARYFLTNEEVINYHGFHNLWKIFYARRHELLSFVNKLRKRLAEYLKDIEPNSIDLAMKHCQFCSAIASSLSTFGIYAGLPGMGKSYAQNHNLIVGFDTDLIGIGYSWRDYSFILKARIPIITNQPALFLGSGAKITVLLSDREIRKDRRGRPMGSNRSVYALRELHPDQIVIIKTEPLAFFSQLVHTAEMVQHQQAQLSNQLFNPNPKRNVNIPEDWNATYNRRLRLLVRA
uniref:Uncharacterized protein n=1 Tax=Soybean thrips partiti-like virus 11 TaxID=2796573 RepID=A0A7T3R0K6_9VIRU|nr:hypothetical protein [Soybean thrips partiti-like virus 11]